MVRSNIDPATLRAVARLISEIADSAGGANCGCRRFAPEFIDDEPCFVGGFNPCDCGRPAPRWGVAGFPPEDKNKVFGVQVRVDEPRREDFWCESDFLRARAKFDRLVDAAEAVDWENKSNTAPLHRVNAVRRPIGCPPPMGMNFLGESHFWD